MDRRRRDGLPDAVRQNPAGCCDGGEKHGKPVIALTGRIGDGIDVLYDQGMDAIFGIVPGAVTLSEALDNGRQNVERTSENIVRLMTSLIRSQSSRE